MKTLSLKINNSLVILLMLVTTCYAEVSPKWYDQGLLVTSVKGKAYYLDSSGIKHIITENLKIPSDVLITTEIKSELTLSDDEGDSLLILSETTVKINSKPTNQDRLKQLLKGSFSRKESQDFTALDILEGRIFFEVEPSHNKNAWVKTPKNVMAVRGTDLHIAVYKDDMQLDIIEGEIELQDSKSNSFIIYGKESARVENGKLSLFKMSELVHKHLMEVGENLRGASFSSYTKGLIKLDLKGSKRVAQQIVDIIQKFNDEAVELLRDPELMFQESTVPSINVEVVE